MNRKCFESFFVLLCSSNGDLIIRLLRVKILGIFCGWVFCKSHRYGKSLVNLNRWWIVAKIVWNRFCYFVLWCKMNEWMNDVMLRLLTVFFVGMFSELVFCKLQNTRWLSNIKWNTGAWSKKHNKNATLQLWHLIDTIL